MFDTMTITKILASLAGALLIFLFANWGAGSLYHVGAPAGHAVEGEEHAAVQGYIIAPVEDEHGDEEMAEESDEPSFADVYAAADADKGAKVFAKCKACHKLDDGANGTGPHLFGAVGRAVASVEDFTGYSENMIALGGDWTPDRLNEFLLKPKDFVAKTKMTFSGLKKVEERANLIAYLATIGG